MVRVYSQPGQLGTTTLGGVYGGHNQYKVTVSTGSTLSRVCPVLTSDIALTLLSSLHA